jgi:hypothetical protein
MRRYIYDLPCTQLQRPGSTASLLQAATRNQRSPREGGGCSGNDMGSYSGPRLKSRPGHRLS